MLRAQRRNVALAASDIPTGENFLYLSRLRLSTVGKYKAGARRVTAFAKKHRKSLLYGPQSVRCALDRTLELFVENLYRSGDGLAEARNAVWGYVHCARLPRKAPGFLFRTKQALAGWKSRAPGKEGRPAPWIATCAIALWLKRHKGRSGLHAARALVVQQRGHMRPSEVLSLLSGDVHVVSRQRRSLSTSGVAVTICPRPDSVTSTTRRTKTNSFEDTIAFDKLCDLRAGHGWVGELLCSLKSVTPASSLLFPISLVELEKLYKEATASLQLDHLRITPHSCRHGGPSEDAAAGIRTAAEIQKRGRWEALKSVNRYMKPGTLLRQLNLIPQAVVTRHQSVLRDLPVELRPHPLTRTRSPCLDQGSAKRRRLG